MAEYVQNKFGDNMWKKVRQIKCIFFQKYFFPQVKEQMNIEVDSFPANEVKLN